MVVIPPTSNTRMQCLDCGPDSAGSPFLGIKSRSNRFGKRSQPMQNYETVVDCNPPTVNDLEGDGGIYSTLRSFAAIAIIWAFATPSLGARQNDLYINQLKSFQHQPQWPTGHTTLYPRINPDSGSGYLPSNQHPVYLAYSPSLGSG